MDGQILIIIIQNVVILYQKNGVTLIVLQSKIYNYMNEILQEYLTCYCLNAYTSFISTVII